MLFHSDILIVDDTPEHIRIAGTILLKQGYRIRVAKSGSDCLKMVEAQHPSIILLDLQLPDINGFTICQKIKSSDETSNIPIIIVTADGNRESLQKGFEMGAQDYIMKPYHASELIARVNAHIRLHAQSLELQSAYDELNQFCHSVSHDLKAPLQVITQLSEIVQEEIESSIVNNDLINNVLNQIMTKCTVTTKMIERLLEFSKMTEQACKYESVDLSQLVPAVFSDLRNLYPERKIELHCENLPMISADATLTSLMVQNIIGNAIKFTRKRNPAIITVTASINQRQLNVIFSDNGVGFDMEYADKLFHVFERLHSQDEYEGSGVGLAIVKRIMTKHGGSVSIEAEPDNGATVTLTFPNLSIIPLS